MSSADVKNRLRQVNVLYTCKQLEDFIHVTSYVVHSPNVVRPNLCSVVAVYN